MIAFSASFPETPVRFSVPLDVFLDGAMSELGKERHNSLTLRCFIDCDCPDPFWDK